MKTAKKLAPTIKAKPLPKASAGANDRIDLTDIPELTAEDWKRGRRRGPERFRHGFHAVPLETIRKGAGLTQIDVAKSAGMTQAEVSRLEGRDSLEGVRLETIRRYVEGLGAKLEIVATFPSGHRMGLSGSPRSEG